MGGQEDLERVSDPSASEHTNQNAAVSVGLYPAQGEPPLNKQPSLHGYEGHTPRMYISHLYVEVSTSAH